MGGVNIESWVLEKGKGSGEALSVIEVKKNTIVVKTTDKLPAKGGVITGTATFLNEFMAPMETSTFTLDGMQTLKNGATSAVEGTNGFGGEISASVGPQVVVKTDEKGFTSTSAGAAAELKVSEKFKSSGFELELKSALKASIADLTQPENISLSLQTAVTVKLFSVDTEFGDWALTGDWQATWSDQSNNGASQSGGITASITKYDGPNKTIDAMTDRIQIRIFSEIVSPAGKSEVNIGVAAGFQWSW